MALRIERVFTARRKRHPSTSTSQLYSVDLTSHTPTLIGSTGVLLIEGLAISSGGNLFATDDIGNLYSVSSTTGAATLIGSTGLSNGVEGLRFDGSTLLATNLNNPTSIYSLNTSTAAATLVTATNADATRAIEISSPNSILASTDDGLGGSQLSSVSLLTGSSSVLGELPSFTASLAFVGGTLYDLDLSGNEYIINPLNGSGTLVGNAGGFVYLDMVAEPSSVTNTPAPGTLVLLGTGMLSLGVGGLRRRFMKKAS